MDQYGDVVVGCGAVAGNGRGVNRNVCDRGGSLSWVATKSFDSGGGLVRRGGWVATTGNMVASGQVVSGSASLQQ